MVYCYSYNNYRYNFGGESILNKVYLLYGLGITNNAIRKFFDSQNVKYIIYCDDSANNDAIFDDIISKTILNKIDVIVKSPGIKFDSNFLKLANILNKSVISDIELYYKLFIPKNMVVVTGSVGKTTIATLISKILSSKNEFKNRLVGNIGLPTFNIANEKADSLIVEASSFMLHYTYKTKPHIMVLSNIIKHHIDYHKTYNSYIKDKLKLIRNMNQYDYVIYNKECVILDRIINKMENVNKISYSVKSHIASCYLENGYITYKGNRIIDISKLKRSEMHNIENYMACICVAKIYKIDNAYIKKAIEEFEGLEYRFEIIYKSEDLIIINDSKSTTPYATVMATNNIKEHYKTYYKVLIVGGIVKESYRQLVDSCEFIDEIFTYGTSNFELAKIFNNNLIKVYDKLEEVINNLPTKKPLLILFSPSCVSYDQYNSYVERGNEFNTLIKKRYKI